MTWRIQPAEMLASDTWDGISGDGSGHVKKGLFRKTKGFSEVL
jgi:hypothetical protein